MVVFCSPALIWKVSEIDLWRWWSLHAVGIVLIFFFFFKDRALNNELLYIDCSAQSQSRGQGSTRRDSEGLSSHTVPRHPGAGYTWAEPYGWTCKIEQDFSRVRTWGRGFLGEGMACTKNGTLRDLCSGKQLADSCGWELGCQGRVEAAGGHRLCSLCGSQRGLSWSKCSVIICCRICWW